MTIDVTVNKITDWGLVHKLALATAGLAPKNQPTDVWKRRMMRAMHSPVRALQFVVSFTVPYWVSVHLVRHNVGVQHFVQSQRTDRTGEPRDKKPQDEPVRHTMLLNAEALVNISKRRLCFQASKETREAWEAVIAAVKEVDPIVAEACVPQCVAYGTCPEMRCCGYSTLATWERERADYLKGEHKLRKEYGCGKELL